MLLPDDVDVLIIGSGPTGLMLANCFNQSTVKYRIVEKKNAIVLTGQADGLKCLIMQIFDSLGISNLVDAGACQVNEIAFWDPDESGVISRSSIMPDIVPGLKVIREVSLNQGKVEQLLLENIQGARSLEVDYGKVPSDIYINETALSDHKEYPFIVMLDSVHDSPTIPLRGSGKPNELKLDPAAGIREAVRAKYVVACDGAHSWMRKRFAIPFDGDQTDSLWGVLDIIPKTDFPDIRKNCVIRSVRHGNMMLIPRENRLVRFYVQLLHANADQDRAAIKSAYSVDALLKAAQRVLSPYELTYDHCDWWSVYQVGQRVSKKYSIHDRLFLAGDAVPTYKYLTPDTHSPKAGQGMNTGIQDAYNLGWKLLATLQRTVHPKILSTYESERRPVAEELISFDMSYAQSWAKQAMIPDSNVCANGMTKFQAMYMRNMTYTTSLLIKYPPSTLVVDSTSSTALQKADGLIPGMRLPDFQVLNQADAVPSQIHKILKSDGRFRVLVFAGDITLASQAARLQELAAGLSSAHSFVHAYRSASAGIDSRIEIITIHASARSEVELQELPAILHPWNENLGWDYWKVYADDRDIHGNHGKAYQECGIDKNQGSLVVIRPDGYVGTIAELTDLDMVNRYFAGFMVPFEQRRG
ncbi:MAG: hypothetical protein ASARMPREDX12_006748 [Alectoria sarmentosa]|nr:MAG: hypothetical protein ASARMPREDX12_006748 [Alectoria sarmentosa]